jgi:hypothetical protein
MDAQRIVLPDGLTVKDLPSTSSEAVKESPPAKEVFSYIEKHEEQTAKDFIEEQLGFEAPRVCGYHMTVKLYIRPDEYEVVTDEGGKKRIVLPSIVTAMDKYKSCTALVLSQGPECYKGKRFEEPWYKKLLRIFFEPIMKPCIKVPWCKPGDWIVFPRNEGTQVIYRGVPIQYIPDHVVLGVISDPTWVVRD